MFDVPFVLSETPDSDWVRLFNESRKFPRHTMWRRASVRGKAIIVGCTLEELEMHLRDLKQDVENANREYRALHAQEIEAENRRKQAEARDKAALDAAVGKLDFSDDDDDD